MFSIKGIIIKTKGLQNLMPVWNKAYECTTLSTIIQTTDYNNKIKIKVTLKMNVLFI